MSSKPKPIIIAPKKKKKKPLLIVSKKKSAAGGAPSSSAKGAARPASPNTVAAAADAAGSSLGAASAGGGGVGAGGGTARSKKSKSSILIKPFERPPELPPDFYDDSLAVLGRALTCVLRHEALHASSSYEGVGADVNEGIATNNNEGNAENNDGTGRLIGREELYRSVEDLCVHKFGSKLYYDVVNIMEGSAGEVVRRLASHNADQGDCELDATIDASGRVGYDASRLVDELNLKDGGVGSGIGGEDHSAKRLALLKRMHRVCRVSYAEEYLTFVRSIFLALDRAYVYYAERELEEIGCGEIGKTAGRLKSPSAAVEVDAVDWDGSKSKIKTGNPPGGRVIERSSASSNNSRVWGLWDVGVACLRMHMARSPIQGPKDGNLSVLTAMVATTAYAILSEYDQNYEPASGDAVLSSSRPLLRDCVRTVIDLGSLPALLEELIVVASARFEGEGRAWGTSLGEGRRNASEFLLHVETRLRQSGGLAGYYLPGNSQSSDALRKLASRDHLAGATGLESGAKVTWSPADASTRRIFPAIIEKHLLGPHLSNSACGVLEPRHLYPMLDDDSGEGGEMAWKRSHRSGSKAYDDAKRLYGLCWRMTASAANSSSNDASPLKPPGGADPRKPSSALDRLRTAFGEYGRLRGAEIVRQGLPGSNNSKEMERRVIPDLLAFKNHLYSLHTVAFRGEDSFGGTVRSILEDVLNGSSSSSIADDGDGDGGRRIAELLAKHVDARFKDAKASAASPSAPTSQPPSSPAAMVTDASESFQNEILALFRHLHSKDVFEAFFKRDLAKRLLTGRAVSTDMERSFLTKLKAECGAGYTSKMEGMFKDMDLSRDIMGSYAAYSAGQQPSNADGVAMDVQVLTTGYWPVYPKYPNIILPQELLALRTKFEGYYDDKYQGRRIAWQYSLGNCIVRANFPRCGPRELHVNVCQSLVLLCFKTEDGDDGRGLTLDDVSKRTGIDDRGELERVLQSLSMGREGTRVLRKVDYDSPTQPASPSKVLVTAGGKDGESPRKVKRQKVRRNVGPHDRFLFSERFSNNQRRIRITNITMKETSEERTKTHASVSKDRLYFIDAAVVRIMKARKAIDHRGLIGEVMAQLRFPATSADIKKRIESLIEREYMERVEGDRSRYKYLA